MRTDHHWLAAERSILLKFEPYNRAGRIGAGTAHASGPVPAPIKLFSQHLQQVPQVGRIELRRVVADLCGGEPIKAGSLAMVLSTCLRAPGLRNRPRA